jgi:hypothetical protein
MDENIFPISPGGLKVQSNQINSYEYIFSKINSLTIIPNEIKLILCSSTKDETNESDNSIGIKVVKNANDESKSLLNKKRRKPHTKYYRDNIKRKIQVNYLKFLVNFVNLIIRVLFKKYSGFNDEFENKKISDKYQFKKLNYGKFAMKTDNDSFNSLKSKKLLEIITLNTNGKNKNNKNDEVYDNLFEIKHKLEKILDQSYLEFFPIYYQKENYTNLKKYGLDIDISLENLKRFDFFIKKEKQKIKELENKEKYEKGIEESIRENFMTNSHLFIVKK